MDSSEEKFFETLAGANAKPEADHEVELAKAEVRAPARAKAAEPKIIEPDEMEGKWNNGEPEGKLMVDVYQTPDDIVVESAIAGAKPDNIDVSATADSVTIRGTRTRENEISSENYLYQECYWGKFARSIILPQEIDPESASVIFKNGILTVRLPKVNKKKTKKLRVSME